MYYASEFRAYARDVLRGKWGAAILTYFVASLLGVTSVLTCFSASGGISFSLPSDTGSTSDMSWIEELFGADVLYAIEDFFTSENIAILIGIFVAVFFFALLIGTVCAILHCVIQFGYAQFHLNLVDGAEARLGNLFGQFKRFGGAFVAHFLVRLFTALWTLLLIIPGIIKTYSYSMTTFVMLDEPELTALQAITRSRQLMDGNKWRLFCLEFSFIGWKILLFAPFFIFVTLFTSFGLVYAASYETVFAILCVIGFVLAIISLIAIPVGLLFLMPYQNTAFAAFYRTLAAKSEPEPEQTTDAYFNLPSDYDPPISYEPPAHSRPNQMADPMATYPPRCSGSNPNGSQI